MCATYSLNYPSTEALIEGLRSLFLFDQSKITEFSILDRIVPYRPAPVLARTKHGVSLQLMNFSLIPHWSKTPRVKFATHNARLTDESDQISILKKPTWRKPFEKQHCVVPLTHFYEPIYEGEFAGQMVSFSCDRLLLAAGIFDHWMHTETGEILSSFAILTDHPHPEIARVGHDRTPIFVKSDFARLWLQSERLSATDWAQELRKKENLFEPEWQTQTDRYLKSQKAKSLI